MSTNIIPFENMGDFASDNAGDFDLNSAAAEFASAKFPVISIANGRFHVKREGVTTLITRLKNKPSDPDEPASYIDMVVLNLQKAKTFYSVGYTPGSEAKPDCLSNDGIKPDVTSEEPQVPAGHTCATCEHNAWGSGTNEKGEATKGKACSDNLRLAVASPANMDDPFMLRVPPASLKNFAEMSKWLTSKRVPVNRAVIRISFDPTKVGVMTFQAIGGLDEATYNKAAALKDSELVLSITGKSNTTLPNLAAPVAHKAIEAPKVVVDKEAAEKKAKVAAKAAKVAAAKAALEAASADDADDDSPVAAAAEKKAVSKTVTSSSLYAELDALLA